MRDTVVEPRRSRSRRRRAPKRRSLAPALWTAALVVLGVFLFFPVALATDRPAFCGSCHEMDPFHDQWATGQHAKTAQCIDCHVDDGLPARFAHKFVALGEVKSHVLGNTSFPRARAASVPNERCTRCHTTLPKTTPDGFSHVVHAAKGTCATCHAATGHNVTPDVLKSAGVFNATFAATTTTVGFAALDAGTANVKGHEQVVCSRCHNMAKTGCPRCHKPPAATTHSWKGDCAQCHTTGAKFAFAHPSSASCEKCHKLPKKHVTPASGDLGACGTCHQAGGRSWRFSHSESIVDCAGCHKKVPAGHYAGQCSLCHHQPGESWKFSHPSAGEHSWKGKPCVKCHPQSYTVVSCTCHGGRPPTDD